LAKDNQNRVMLKNERIRYWLEKGAKPTDRVARFLGSAEIIPMPEQKNNPQKANPKAKAQERLAALAEAEDNVKAEAKASDEDTSGEAAEEKAEAEAGASDEDTSGEDTKETLEK
jgi:small subunit ribosomal protein S16